MRAQEAMWAPLVGGIASRVHVEESSDPLRRAERSTVLKAFMCEDETLRVRAMIEGFQQRPNVGHSEAWEHSAFVCGRHDCNSCRRPGCQTEMAARGACSPHDALAGRLASISPCGWQRMHRSDPPPPPAGPLGDMRKP